MKQYIYTFIILANLTSSSYADKPDSKLVGEVASEEVEEAYENDPRLIRGIIPKGVKEADERGLESSRMYEEDAKLRDKTADAMPQSPPLTERDWIRLTGKRQPHRQGVKSEDMKPDCVYSPGRTSPSRCYGDSDLSKEELKIRRKLEKRYREISLEKKKDKNGRELPLEEAMKLEREDTHEDEGKELREMDFSYFDRYPDD